MKDGHIPPDHRKHENNKQLRTNGKWQNNRYGKNKYTLGFSLHQEEKEAQPNLNTQNMQNQISQKRHTNNHCSFAEMPTSEVIRGKNYKTNLTFCLSDDNETFPCIVCLRSRVETITLCNVESVMASVLLKSNVGVFTKVLKDAFS